MKKTIIPLVILAMSRLASAAVCNCASCAVLEGTHLPAPGSFILSQNIELENVAGTRETAWNLSLSTGITERLAFSLYSRTSLDNGFVVEALAPSLQILLSKFELNGKPFHLHFEVGGQIAPQGEEDEEDAHPSETSAVASHDRNLVFARVELDTRFGETLVAGGFIFTQYTEGDRETRPGYTARVLTGITEQTLLGIEVAGDIGAGRGYHEAGATFYYQLTPTIQLHAGSAFGISEDKPLRSVRAGLSLRF